MSRLSSTRLRRSRWSSRRADVRRQQAVQAEGVALLFSKCRALVEARIQQQIESMKAGANHGSRVAMAVRRGEFCCTQQL